MSPSATGVTASTASVDSYSCDHPMIQRGEDGGTYCTECKQRVA